MSLSQPPILQPTATPAPPISRISNPQLTSPFFTLLPFEIRQQIYKEVIACFSWGKKLHILSRDQEPIERSRKPKELISQLTYIPCTLPAIDPLPLSQNIYGYSSSWPTQHEWCQGWKATGQAPPCLQGTYLSIFLSCRRISEEAIGLLYSEHSFALTSLRTMDRFLTTVPPQHLNLIQSLHLTMIIPDIHLAGPAHPSELHITAQIKRLESENEWLRSCIALAHMTGLKNLEMEFWNETYEDVVEEELLRGLSSVKVSKGGNFVVRVPWKEGNPIPKVERMSFVGVRLERRAFGVEPAIDRAITYPHPTRVNCWEVVFAIACCPCILLVCVGSGVKSLVKKTMRRRS